MRKIFTFLFAALMSVGMWADVPIVWFDLPDEGDSYSNDGVTLTCALFDHEGGGTNMYAPGTFTTDLGNFTQIAINADNCNMGYEDGWQGSTWTGNASSVSFSGSVHGLTSIMFTIEGGSAPADPIVVTQGTCGDNLQWSYADGTLTITGTGAMTDWTPSDDVPWFYYSDDITSVSLPDGLTNIGGRAFYLCTALTSITIPSTVTSYGEYAFANSGLTSVEISSNVQSIGESAFSGSGLTSVTIPSSVVSIGESAFINCSQLTSVTLPDEVTNIGDNAFCNIGMSEPLYNSKFFAFLPKTYVGAYTIPSGITHIVGGAINSCTSLTAVTIPSTVTRIGGNAFHASGITSIEIPASVKTIGEAAFSSCGSLTSVTLNEGLETIGEQAFLFTGLSEVTIPTTVTSIGGGAFYGCASLTTVNVSRTEPATLQLLTEETSTYTFTNCNSALKIYVPSSLVSTYQTAWSEWASKIVADPVVASGNCGAKVGGEYGNNLTWKYYSDNSLVIEGTGEMADWTFFGNVPWYNYSESITSISLPDGLTTIGQKAFMECSALTSITIPSTVTGIGEDAFRNSGLTSVNIPTSVVSIGGYAFLHCSNLTSVTLPNSVTSLGDSPFKETGLTEPLYNSKFFAFMPQDYEGAYEFPSGIQEIVGGSLNGCTSITSVTIPSSVTIIRDWAFSASSVTSVTFNEGLQILEGGAFTMCPNLEDKMELPSSVDSIGNETFSYSSVKHAVLHSTSMIKSGEDVFKSHVQILECISVPAGLVGSYKDATNWSDYADYFAAINEAGVISWSYVESSGTLYIWKNSSDATIAMPDYTEGNAPWKDYATSITKVVIYDDITTIGAYAFSGCTALTNIAISAHKASIGEGAFKGCTSLATLEIKNSSSITSLGTDALSGCSALNLIQIPIANASEYKAATSWSTYADIMEPVIIWGGSDMESLGDHGSGESASVSDITLTTGNPGELSTIYSSYLGCYVMFGNWTAFFNEEADELIAGTYTFSSELGNFNKIVIDYNATVTNFFAYIFPEGGSGWTNDTENRQLIWEGTPSNSVSLTAGLAVDQIKFFFEVEGPAPTVVTSGNCGPKVGEEYSDNLTWKYYSDNSLVIEGSGAMTDWTSSGDVPWEAYCSSITSVSLPDGLTNIGGYAFNNFIALTSITIPSSVTSYGEEAFANSGLTSVEISSNVQSIGDHAFDDSKLESVVIPSTVESIGNSAFNRCENLTSVTLPDEVTNIGDYAFSNIGVSNPLYNSTRFVYLPLTYEGAYTIPDGITHIVGGSINTCESLTAVTIPSTVTSIGEAAFGGSGITFIEIPASVKTIGEAAFYYCTSLAEVTLNEGLETIGEAAFLSTAISKVTIPTTVTSIGGGAFAACENLTTVNASATTPATLGGGEFEECNSALKIYVPSSLVSTYKTAWSEWEDKIVAASTPTAIENVQTNHVQAIKFFRDGMLFIEKNGKIYNATGAEVK